MKPTGMPKRSKRRIAMMSMLATGWLPWGIEWAGTRRPHMPRSGGRYIMCCGHVMGRSEAQLFIDSGLLEIAEVQGPSLVITDKGLIWLQQNW